MRTLAAERYERETLLFLLSEHADELFSKEGGTEGHGKHGIYGKGKGTRAGVHRIQHARRTGFEVYVVWNAYILGNMKALLSTTVEDGMYYEVTYNKAKNEIYLDAYKHAENICYTI